MNKSVGSPLAALVAKIFVQDIEKIHPALFEELDIVSWKRYIDDTFILLDPDVDHKVIRARLSQCHHALQLTSE